MEILATGPFWVLVAVLIFFGITIYLKVPGMLAAQLDKRSNEIAGELDQARRLREEAQELLASYKRKQEEAMKEAEAIIAQAKVEAERLAVEMRANMQAQVERRQKQAEDKIRQAETQALQEVRAAAADVAVTAAKELIAGKVDTAKDASLIEKSISELPSKLH
ncbi:MAG: ATP F0F1 synthase subunit B [Parvibaculum sp.]|uniref:F0F1 ATP synthase subunit B family protein n=1 Tax=Parvibaculum sp. TaxID=2024848 RepID=UPI003C70A132